MCARQARKQNRRGVTALSPFRGSSPSSITVEYTCEIIEYGKHRPENITVTTRGIIVDVGRELPGPC